MKPSKENIFINLSKLSEEQIKALPQMFENSGDRVLPETLSDLISGKITDGFKFLFYSPSGWNQNDYVLNGRTELTYPEFIKLFEGGEDYPGKQYQPLFDHLNNEHGLILHESEMDEIIRIVGGLNSNQ